MASKLFGVLIGAGLALLPCAASAERIDLNTIKCGEWIESGKENIAYSMAWIDGYYQDEDADPVIDFDKMKAKAEKLGAFCAANRDLGLGTAAERLFGK